MAQSGSDGSSVLRILRTHPRVECTAVEALSHGTAAQIVWLLGDECQIQIAEWVPLGLRAAVMRHVVEKHTQECCTRSCSEARAWVADAAVMPASVVVRASLPA